MAEDYRSGTVKGVNPGGDTLPDWIKAAAPLALIAFIVIGGLWMKRLEDRARTLERGRGDEDEGGTRPRP